MQSSKTVVVDGGSLGSGAVAARPDPRLRQVVVAVVVLLIVLAVAIVASLAIGSRPVEPLAVLRALFAPDASADTLIVRDLRIPRTLTAVLVGGALGFAGLLMQATTRNPLADPGLLGVNAGASVAVVLGISVLGLGTAGEYVWLALIGAGGAAALVHLVGARGGDTTRTVLAGVALGASLSAVTGIVTLLDDETFESYRFWVVGSLERRDLEPALQLVPFLLVGALVGVAALKGLELLALGPDVARSLGARPGVVIALAGLAITLLCGSATALAGPMSFVGLLVAHLARGVAGADLRRSAPVAVIGGAVILVVSDVLGRVVAYPGEIEAGIVTAFVGAPVLFWLVRRRRVS